MPRPVVTTITVGDHVATLQALGGGCAYCPRGNSQIALYGCTCGVCSACRDCLREHTHELAVRLGLLKQTATFFQRGRRGLLPSDRVRNTVFYEAPHRTK